MTMFLKEKLLEYLLGTRGSLLRELRQDASKVDLHDASTLKKCLDRQSDIGKKVYYLLATGNVVSSTGLDLMQVAGYTIVAEKLNQWRYLSHFRSVHRGQFFTEMKTTAPRKLLPESWGFLCCVGPPLGAPGRSTRPTARPAACSTTSPPPAPSPPTKRPRRSWWRPAWRWGWRRARRAGSGCRWCTARSTCRCC